MGSCFLSLLEAQSSLLGSAAEIMSPLGSYKEVGQGLIDTKNTSAVKEATLGWLAAAQVSRHCKLPALLFHGIFCPRSFLYFIQIDSWGGGGVGEILQAYQYNMYWHYCLVQWLLLIQGFVIVCLCYDLMKISCSIALMYCYMHIHRYCFQHF